MITDQHQVMLLWAFLLDGAKRLTEFYQLRSLAAKRSKGSW